MLAVAFGMHVFVAARALKGILLILLFCPARRMSFVGALLGPTPGRATPRWFGARASDCDIVAMDYILPGPNMSRREAKLQEIEDYHKTFDTVSYMEWFEKKLLPALKEPSLILFDHAPFHTAMDPDVSKLKKAGRAEICAYLRTRGVNANPKSRKEVVASALKKYIEDNHLRCLADAVARSKGHRVLLTPRYMSAIQPIEKIWAIIKQRVGNLYDRDTTFATTVKRTKEAFEKLRAEKGLLQSIIDHVNKTVLPTFVEHARLQLARSAANAGRVAAAAAAGAAAGAPAPAAKEADEGAEDAAEPPLSHAQERAIADAVGREIGLFETEEDDEEDEEKNIGDPFYVPRGQRQKGHVRHIEEPMR